MASEMIAVEGDELPDLAPAPELEQLEHAVSRMLVFVFGAVCAILMWSEVSKP
jgi:hypothetical protein